MTVYVNKGLVFTYTEAESMGISKSHFLTILKKLIEVGFIDIEHQGGGLARDFSRYAFSARWTEYGTKNFKLVEKKRLLWPGHDVRSRMINNNLAKTHNKKSELLVSSSTSM
jgi:Mn-dependent DtxR family transcriptional regulator